MSQSTENMHSN